MKVAVIGAGRVGSTLGRAFAAAGHEVIYGVRESGTPRDALEHERARVTDVESAVAASDVVLLATPWAATQAALESVSDFGQRPLLDATNPLGAGLSMTHGHNDSGGEQVQRWAPTARVAKVFNTTGMENMAQPRFGEAKTVMPVAVDDERARQAALSLAADIGFDAIDAGPLRNAGLLESMGRLWIELALVRGHGRSIAFGLLRR